VQTNLASAYQVAGKLPQAIRLFEQVRDSQLRKLGTDHRSTLHTLHNPFNLNINHWSLYDPAVTYSCPSTN
jgi:hypothetical protein